MKLLKIIASGLPRFADRFEIDFVAVQKVTSDDANKMNCLFSANSQHFYQNNVLSFIGINASGKTLILKLISFVCGILNNQLINSIPHRDGLDGLKDNGSVAFDIFFYANNQTVNLLHTVIGKANSKFIILDEYLKSKPISKVRSKAMIFDFEEYEPVLVRNNDDAFLLEDVSIMVAYNKKVKDTLVMIDMLQHADINELNIFEDCFPELIAFFDPSIEYLRVGSEDKATGQWSKGKNTDIQLKFYGKEEIFLHRLSDLNRYLSSGTIKGINIFMNTMKVFETGGCLIVDELENYLNHEIISTLIRFYTDKKVNLKDATLIFSTHYAELLDEFDRNDNIYIVRNRNGICAENLSVVFQRNDIKKSEAYQSGLFGETAPMYDAYAALKKRLICSLR